MKPTASTPRSVTTGERESVDRGVEPASRARTGADAVASWGIFGDRVAEASGRFMRRLARDRDGDRAPLAVSVAIGSDDTESSG